MSHDYENGGFITTKQYTKPTHSITYNMLVVYRVNKNIKRYNHIYVYLYLDGEALIYWIRVLLTQLNVSYVYNVTYTAQIVSSEISEHQTKSQWLGCFMVPYLPLYNSAAVVEL